MYPSRRQDIFGGEASSTAVYLYNRRWHSTINSTPYQQLYGAKPAISHLRSWFTHVLVHIPSDKRGKLDQPVEEGFLVGYTSNPTVFRIYIPKRHTITESKDVKFDRIRGVSLKYHNEPTIQQPTTTPTQHTTKIPGSFPEPERQSFRPYKITDKAKDTLHLEKEKMKQAIKSQYKKMDTEAKTFNHKMKTLEDPCEIEDVKQQQVLLRQHGQERIVDLQKRIDQKKFAGLMYHIPDPNSYREAVESYAAEQWKQAMDEGMKVLKESGVGEEVNRPIDKTVEKGRWVYKTKVKKEGSIERRKGRYCAKGYSQKPGEDFDDIYAPVARLESLRIVLSISVKRNYTLRQLDVKSTFIYGDIDGETYLELPEIYQKPGKVWRLNKAIYGLKQSPRLWYFHLTEAPKNMNLTVTDFDSLHTCLQRLVLLYLL